MTLFDGSSDKGGKGMTRSLDLASRVTTFCPTGLSLVDLLVSLFIITLLAAVGYSPYANALETSREALVVENMRSSQFAVEAFAADFGGAYPQGIDNGLPGGGFAYYFPGGDEETQSHTGTYPKNPYTGQHMTAASFLVRVLIPPRDLRDESIGGLNDYQLGCPGMIAYAQCPNVQNFNVCAFVGARCDRLTIRIGDRIVVFHN